MAILKNLPEFMRREVMSKAARAGGKLLKRQIAANIRTMVGRGSRIHSRSKETRKVSLARTIVVRQLRKKKQFDPAVLVGAARPHGAHAHLIEFGHEIKRQKKDTRAHASRPTRYKSNKFGTRTKPIPFQRSAETQSQAAVFNEYRKAMAIALKKLAGGRKLHNSYAAVIEKGAE